VPERDIGSRQEPVAVHFRPGESRSGLKSALPRFVLPQCPAVQRRVRCSGVRGADIARGLLFGDHPLGQRVIGPSENVRRFDDADVRRHFARCYGARNTILCVAGPIDADEVFAAARARLGGLPEGARLDAAPIEFDQTGTRYRYVRDTGSQVELEVVFRAVPETDPDYVASMALLRALDDGLSTPLHYRLCDQRGLAYSVDAGIEPLADVAVFEISGATSPTKVPDLVRGIFEICSEFRSRPISDDELARIKRRYRTDFLSSLDDGVAMASWYGGTALYYPPPRLEQRLADMDAITARDVQAAAERIFRPDHLAVAAVGPLSRARQGQLREMVATWR